MEPSTPNIHSQRRSDATSKQSKEDEPGDGPYENSVIVIGKLALQPHATGISQTDNSNAIPDETQRLDRERVNNVVSNILHITPDHRSRGEGNDPMGRDYKGIDPSDLTVRGTPRVRRPYRSREELQGESQLEANKLDVKLGARVPRELRDEFVEATKKAGVTQTLALTQAIENYIDNLDL